MGKHSHRSLRSPSPSSDDSLPDMSPPAKRVDNKAVSEGTKQGVPASMQSLVNHALLGELGAAGAANAGAFEALQAAASEVRIVDQLFTRRAADFPDVKLEECVLSLVGECRSAITHTVGVCVHERVHSFPSHMASRLNVAHSVTHEPTFDDYTLKKEMEYAFVNIPQSFRWCARKHRLSEKDRNSALGRFILRGEGASADVRDAYEAKLRAVWAERYA
jgi:hypothetical protein